MLRTLHRFLRTGVPVLGVNFGRVGFLTSIGPGELEPVLRQVLAGEYVVHRLPSLLVDTDGATRTALNDVVGTSSTLGRMIEVGWAVGARIWASSRATHHLCDADRLTRTTFRAAALCSYGDSRDGGDIVGRTRLSRPLVVPRAGSCWPNEKRDAA